MTARGTGGRCAADCQKNRRGFHGRAKADNVHNVVLRDYLPEWLRPVVADERWGHVLRERRATCDDCLQARGPTAIYKQSLKCCTFFPFLPNYSIGALLETQSVPAWLVQSIAGQADESGRHSRSEAVVLPLGLMPAIGYQRRFKDRQPDGFGNDVSLLCPHFLTESGGCGIWTLRPSPCRSFFCESSHGIRGTYFWTAFEKWLSFVELALAQEALRHLGFTESELRASTRFLPSYGSPDPHAPSGAKHRLLQRQAWLEFHQEKAVFYERCWRFVGALNSAAVRDCVGEEGARLEAELLAQFP